MVIHMSRCTVTLAADPDGVFYKLRRDVAETVRGVDLPTGIVAACVAPRVCDVAALVWLLFGERWAVN